jgi:hypothetical protein
VARQGVGRQVQGETRCAGRLMTAARSKHSTGRWVKSCWPGSLQHTPAAQTRGRQQRAPGCLRKVERRKGGINNEEQKVAHACCTHTQRKTVAQDCCTAATAGPAALALLNTPPQQQNHPPVGEGLLWKAT